MTFVQKVYYNYKIYSLINNFKARSVMAIIATLIYGIACLVGGLIGYLQARSKISLISGGISGLLLLICSYFQSQGAGWSFFMAAVISLILIIVFSVRLQKTRKFMPAGLMVALGVVVLLLNIFR